MHEAAALPLQPAALSSARAGDEDAFQRLVEPYRREIQLHCYRMLGSFQDAEDLVQVAFLRAWRGLDGFEGRTSFRNWLYRIATNACLNVLARRANTLRLLPEMQGAPATEMPGGGRPTEIPWLDPYPDSALEGVADDTPGPEARYEMREAVQLAFVAAIQLLPARQRAVLLLRDVLGWSAAETAGLLDTTLASANSALQRARATLTQQFPAGQPAVLPSPDDDQRALLDRYVQAWEQADAHAFAALLRDDAILSMPPWPHWYRGREAIERFFVWAWRHRQFNARESDRLYRFIPTSANRQPAFAVYLRMPGEEDWHAHGVQVLALQDGAVASIVTFIGSRYFAPFGLPSMLGDLPSEAGAPAPEK